MFVIEAGVFVVLRYLITRHDSHLVCLIKFYQITNNTVRSYCDNSAVIGLRNKRNKQKNTQQMILNLLINRVIQKCISI